MSKRIEPSACLDSTRLDSTRLDVTNDRGTRASTVQRCTYTSAEGRTCRLAHGGSGTCTFLRPVTRKTSKSLSSSVWSYKTGDRFSWTRHSGIQRVRTDRERQEKGVADTFQSFLLRSNDTGDRKFALEKNIPLRLVHLPFSLILSILLKNNILF